MLQQVGSGWNLFLVLSLPFLRCQQMSLYISLGEVSLNKPNYETMWTLDLTLCCKGALFNSTTIYYFYRRLSPPLPSSLSSCFSFFPCLSCLPFYSILQWSTGCPLTFNSPPALAPRVLGLQMGIILLSNGQQNRKQLARLRPKKEKNPTELTTVVIKSLNVLCFSEIYVRTGVID